MDGGDWLMIDWLEPTMVYFFNTTTRRCSKTAPMAAMMRMEMIILHLLLW